MKQKINVFLILLISICVFAIPSCKKTLDELADMNKNENQPLIASSPSLLTAAEYSGVFLNHGGFGDGPLGVFSQHLAGNHATGTEYNQYQLTHGSFGYLFNDAYVSSLINLKQLITNAGSKEQGYIGVAKILQAYQLGYLTTLYGDIPWSEALDIKKYHSPKYDAQADVYTAVQKLLQEGIANINMAPAGSSLKGDVIYGGNLGKWKATAYLLRARYYNHLSKKDPMGSASSALKMVDSAIVAGFSSHASDFKLPYETGATITNPWFGHWTNGMYPVNVKFLNTLLSTNDPRLHAYLSSTDGVTGSNVAGSGKAISGNVGTGKYMLIGPDSYSYFGNINSATLMATYAELLMIEAEAALRSGDLGRAANAHNAAIKAQIKEVTSLDNEPAHNTPSKIPVYINQYASETAGTISLQKIMTEKFKLMFTMEAESWMDVRRYDYKYPSILAIPVVDETASPTVPVAATFIQRLLYPQSELDNNAANVPKATLFDKLPILK